MNEIKLRRITLQDVPTLSLLANKTFYDTFTGTSTPADMQSFLDFYYNEKSLAIEVENKAYQYYFALLDDEIVGYLLFAENNE